MVLTLEAQYQTEIEYFHSNNTLYSFYTTAFGERFLFLLNFFLIKVCTLYNRSIYSHVQRCGTSSKQVSSYFHLHYYSYKQLFPHQPFVIFSSLEGNTPKKNPKQTIKKKKTQLVVLPRNTLWSLLSWRSPRSGKLLSDTKHCYCRLLPKMLNIWKDPDISLLYWNV